MIRFDFPEPDLPLKYLNIFSELQTQGILLTYGERLTFPDEPQFYQYACERISGNDKNITSFGYGCSQSQSEAFQVAVSEAIEHYCILYEPHSTFIRNTYKEIQNKATNPLRFCPFSDDQLNTPQYKKFKFNTNTQLNWVKGYSLTKRKSTYVPAGAVYAKYDAKFQNEPIIQLPNNTGAANGETIDFAIYKGLCEIIERDQYMISFINNLPKMNIDVSKDPELAELDFKIRRYDLEPYYICTNTDAPITTTTCILLDRTGSGPAVCTGLGGDKNPIKAIKTAAFEAVRRHISARDRYFRNKPLRMPKKYSFDWFLLEKQKRWTHPTSIDLVKSFLNNKTVPIKQLKQFNVIDYKKEVELLIHELDKLGCEVIFVNVTTPEIRALGMNVVKMLVPEMVPLWRDERYPYLGYSRLNSVPKKLGLKSKRKIIEKIDFTYHPF